jgi:hypothetical protein
MLEPMEEDLGESPAGSLRRERAELRAERIIAEELRRHGWRADRTTTWLQEFKRQRQTGSGN